MIKTKIIVTLGPASRDAGMIARLIEAGVDVFRLNFSHGTREGHAAMLSAVREQADRLGATIAVLGDLGGPKIRLGELADDAMDAPPGSTLIVQRRPVVGRDGRVSCTYPQLIDDVTVGQRILVADGQIRLTVAEKRPDEVACTVEIGGTLHSKKGINLPDTRVSSPAVTEKDGRDLEWAVANRLDYLALSFVRRAEDVVQLKRQLAELGGAEVPVIAKIEKPEALEEIDAIIEASDGVMVARGDLGVELELARVPLVQKDLTARCHAACVPVIIATQMLSSMVDRPTATRAEISDIANAVLDRADACMLSEETAVGHYPLESVRTMARVAEVTEAFGAGQPLRAERVNVPDELTMPAGIAAGAATITDALGAACVVVWTASGATARLVSKQRLGVPILGLSPSQAAANRMALFYGVEPCRLDRPGDDAAMLRLVDGEVVRHRLAAPGELILIVSGTKVAAPGETNSMMIHRVWGE